MKFDTTVKFQRGISYTSLAVIILFSISLGFIASKISENSPSVNTDGEKEKIELQKKINENSDNLSKDETPIEKRIEKDSKVEPSKELENKEVVRKASTRELGFDIDFGSEGPRIIKNFVLPEAKNLGSGRVLLKFRFSIRPDGSVAKVFPIMKGDPNLELETMNLLRKWRFEKLDASKDQTDQKVEISFRPQ